jgi:hypothetical protein
MEQAHPAWLSTSLKSEDRHDCLLQSGAAKWLRSFRIESKFSSVMLFVILHTALVVLIFLPDYTVMKRNDWQDARARARNSRLCRRFFWSGFAVFCICAACDLHKWPGFTVPVRLFVGFLGVCSLWKFGDYCWNCMRHGRVAGEADSTDKSRSGSDW